MTTKVQKWGNSLAVRVPKELARGLHMREGSNVVLSSEGDALVIRPGKTSKVTLIELLKKVDMKNVHGESDWGKPVGNETW